MAIYEENDCIIIKGTIRETALFGYNLELKRTIRIPAMGSDIIVTDEITNLGAVKIRLRSLLGALEEKEGK